MYQECDCIDNQNTDTYTKIMEYWPLLSRWQKARVYVLVIYFSSLEIVKRFVRRLIGKA